MLLQGFACRVPGAAEGVLHLAGLSFSDSGLPQAWIGYKAADALFDRALQLVGNSLDPVGINPHEQPAGRGSGDLCLSACLLGGAVRGHFRIAYHLADGSLHSSPDLLADPLDLLVVYFGFFHFVKVTYRGGSRHCASHGNHGHDGRRCRRRCARRAGIQSCSTAARQRGPEPRFRDLLAWRRTYGSSASN